MNWRSFFIVRGACGHLPWSWQAITVGLGGGVKHSAVES